MGEMSGGERTVCKDDATIPADGIIIERVVLFFKKQKFLFSSSLFFSLFLFLSDEMAGYRGRGPFFFRQWMGDGDEDEEARIANSEWRTGEWRN